MCKQSFWTKDAVSCSPMLAFGKIYSYKYIHTSTYALWPLARAACIVKCMHKPFVMQQYILWMRCLFSLCLWLWWRLHMCSSEGTWAGLRGRGQRRRAGLHHNVRAHVWCLQASVQQDGRTDSKGTSVEISVFFYTFSVNFSLWSIPAASTTSWPSSRVSSRVPSCFDELIWNRLRLSCCRSHIFKSCGTNIWKNIRIGLKVWGKLVVICPLSNTFKHFGLNKKSHIIWKKIILFINVLHDLFCKVADNTLGVFCFWVISHIEISCEKYKVVVYCG